MLFNNKAIEKLLKEDNPDFKIQDYSSSSWNTVEQKLSIMSYDVPSIKKYIFASNDFKAIVGASKALDKFDSTAKKVLEAEGTHVIITAGGTGLAICRISNKEKIEEKLKKSFTENVPGAKLIISFVDLPTKEIMNGLQDLCDYSPQSELIEKLNTQNKFSDLFQFLSVKLRENRNYALNEYSVIPPEIKRCEFCNQEPATIKLPSYEEEVEICEYCYKKHELGRKFIENNDNRMASGIDDIDIETNPSRKTKWYGVIYIDGNNLGQLYSRIKDEEDYKKKSEKIDYTVKNSLNKIISEFSLEKKYLAPILGGDDLLLFLPAALAFDVFNKLSSEIEKGFKELGIGFCASIAIIPKKLPIKFVFDISSILLKSAKKEAYKENPINPGNYIAFRTLYGNTLDPVNEIIYFSDSDILNNQLTVKEILGKGIKLEEFKKIIEELKKDKKDYTQLFQKTLSCIRDHPVVAKLNILYFLKRSKAFENLQLTPKDFIEKFQLLKTVNNELYETRIQTLLDILKTLNLKSEEMHEKVR